MQVEMQVPVERAMKGSRKERKERAKAKMQRDKIAVAMGPRGRGRREVKREKREMGRGSEKKER